MESLLKSLTEPQQIGGSKGTINGYDGAETRPAQSPQFVAGPIQMIGGDGTFFEDDTSGFITDSKELTAHGTPYAVISLLGSQSPGKGFLCNSLFSFDPNSDASKARGQNSRGIWLSRCTGPSLLIMDMDYSDTREDDVSFAKQSFLFALSVSDLLIINMSFLDFNKDHPGTMQLLKTLFEERVKIDPSQTKMLVVLHGYDDKAPLTKLHEDVFAKMEKVWTSTHNKPDSPRFLFGDFFEVLVVGFPDKSKAIDFEDKVSKLRNWFVKDEILGFKHDKVSAVGFTLSAKSIWETIRQKKRLNLLANRLLVSSFYCERIVKEKLESLTSSSQEILTLKKSSEDFSENLKSLLDLFLTRYDLETQMYEADVKMQIRHELETGILKLVENLCKDALSELHSKAFYKSKEEIANQLNQSDIIINDVIDSCVKKFIISCNDLCSKYEELCNEHSEALKRELTNFAEIISENIKERRKREEAEKAREEAELKSETLKLETEKFKTETDHKILQYKTEAENAKKETEIISENSSQEIQRLSEEKETAEREIEVLKEEQKEEREKAKERELAETKRRGVQRRFGLVRAVVVVARVVVLKDPTVIVDILEFVLWNKCYGESSNSQKQKD